MFGSKRFPAPAPVPALALRSDAKTSSRGGRDFGVKERYNVARRSMRDPSCVGPGPVVDLVDARSRVLVREK
jgi:hypothetical protein